MPSSRYCASPRQVIEFVANTRFANVEEITASNSIHDVAAVVGAGDAAQGGAEAIGRQERINGTGQLRIGFD